MKLSIITINFNNDEGLQKTIKSVINQNYTEFEYIIIDGGSSDSSIEIINNHKDKIDYWISEPDAGVFNAMNKGIKKANGEYLLMLNSGDYLFGNDTLSAVFEDNLFTEDIIYGDVVRESQGRYKDKSFFPDHLTFQFLMRGALSHQATFIRKKAHDIVGLYDEDLKFSSDWKFLILAICKFNLSYKRIPQFLAVADCEGLTCNPSNFSAMQKENNMILQTYFSAFLPDYENYNKILNSKITRKIGNLKSKVRSRISNYLASY